MASHVVWGFDAAEWQAIAAVVAVAFAVVVAAPIAFLQAREARILRKDQSRPYVIVDFEFRSILVYLKIENIGTSAARDVRIEFDKPLESSLTGRREIDESPLFREPIPMLAPGRRISVFFDAYNDRQERGLPMQYRVTLKYKDTTGEKFNDPPYPLDLGTYEGSSLAEAGLPELVAKVGKISDELGKWTNGISGILVHTVDDDKARRRRMRPVLRQNAAQIRKDQGIRAYVRLLMDRKLRQYGWKRR